MFSALLMLLLLGVSFLVAFSFVFVFVFYILAFAAFVPVKVFEGKVGNCLEMVDQTTENELQERKKDLQYASNFPQ